MDRDGTCGLCRSQRERGQRPLARALLVLGVTSLVAATVWVLLPLRLGSGDGPPLKELARPPVHVAIKVGSKGAEPRSHFVRSGEGRSPVPPSDESEDVEVGDQAVPFEAVPFEDVHLGKNAGSSPAAPRAGTAPVRVPAAPVPTDLHLDVEPVPPDDARDFELPPAPEHEREPWRPAL